MLVAFLNQAFSNAVQAGGVSSNLHSNGYLLEAIGSILMQVKGFIQNVSLGQYQGETTDSLRKLLKFTPIDQVTSLLPCWTVIGPGLFETLHTNRMSTPSEILIENLSAEVSLKIVFNDEVRTQVQFVETKNGKPFLGVVPFNIEFIAGL